MKKKEALTEDKFYLTHKIEFIPDKDAEEILIKNCEYRHFLYNKAVEKIKEDSKDNLLEFSEYNLVKYIRHKYELDNPKDRPNYLEPYDYYFRGISECVVSDTCTICKTVIMNRKKGKLSDLRFRKYDPNTQSFSIKNKIPFPLSQSRLVFDPSNSYLLGIKINRYQPYPLGITLREDLNKFISKGMDLTKIKKIAIKLHNDRWHIFLVEDCTDRLDKFKILVPKKRSKLAGIDIGEKNPVVIYDGKKIVKIPDHLQYPKDRIDKSDRRIRRLQRVLDSKYRKDLPRHMQSNNYKKVLAKYHKACERLVNIKHDWHNKLAHWIVTHYKTIIVDNFSDHIIETSDDMCNTIRRNMNHSMQNKGMCNFMCALMYMSTKYGTNYYEALPDTTNMCCHCGNVNENVLDINERTFVCESCGNTVDRDENASINCFNQYTLLKNS